MSPAPFRALYLETKHHEDVDNDIDVGLNHHREDVWSFDCSYYKNVQQFGVNHPLSNRLCQPIQEYFGKYFAVELPSPPEIPFHKVSSTFRNLTLRVENLIIHHDDAQMATSAGGSFISVQGNDVVVDFLCRGRDRTFLIHDKFTIRYSRDTAHHSRAATVDIMGIDGGSKWTLSGIVPEKTDEKLTRWFSVPPGLNAYNVCATIAHPDGHTLYDGSCSWYAVRTKSYVPLESE